MPIDSSLPRHIAIIPDGNRRWAKSQGLPPGEGHRRGVRTFHDVIDEAFLRGVSCLTFWAASEDNLTKRSRLEVRLLVKLLRDELISKEFKERLVKDKVRVRFVGRWNEILRDPKLAESIREIESKTEDFNTSFLTILFGYDGRREMMDAVGKISQSGNEVTLDAIDKALWTGFLPPVDLVIRTGEEEVGWTHWSSGFMMWLTAQSQFYFTKTFWPGFSLAEFDRVLKEFGLRERRFGK